MPTAGPGQNQKSGDNLENGAQHRLPVVTRTNVLTAVYQILKAVSRLFWPVLMVSRMLWTLHLLRVMMTAWNILTIQSVSVLMLQ